MYIASSMDVFAIILGLILLIKGGNWLFDAAIGLSLLLNIPKIVIGMTVVSFATSAPELIVSINAASEGYADLALGNVLGSNIANLALVLGVVLLISPIDVTPTFYKVDAPMMLLASLLFYVFSLTGNTLDPLEGGFLFILLIVFLIFLLFFQKKAIIEVDHIPDKVVLSSLQILMYLWIGGFCLWLGSEVLIKGTIGLATIMGISERVISITVVSIGTSIPELSASLIAIINKEKAISLGNLIGSNIFNILAVMGITAMITPIQIQDLKLLEIDFIWMLLISVLVFVLVFIPSKMRLGRWEGAILLSLYSLFLYQLLA
ncbi:MAG: calcium/sodium antiporter [Flavobacteriaceae bacterium]